MPERRYESEETTAFLEDVLEQINYKPLRLEVAEELNGHMEDRTREYMSMGLDQDGAIHRAVAGMGDASAIGVAINEARHVQKSKPLLVFVGICLLLGVLGNFREYGAELGEKYGLLSIIIYSDYFIWGILILGGVYFFGYQIAVKHSRLILLAMGMLTAVLCFVNMGRFIQWVPWGMFMQSLAWNFVSPALSFAAMLLFCISAVMLAAHFRHVFRRSLFVCTLFTISISVLYIIITDGFVFAACLILLVTVAVSFLHMITKGYFMGNRKKQYLAAGTVFTLLFLFYGIVLQNGYKADLKAFIWPETQAVDIWEDAYNSILIRELLGRAEPLGEAAITAEELVRYGTGEWYFGEAAVFRSYDIKNVTLEDILPQHYHNNYRIAYWILHYGWLPTMALLGVILCFYVTLFVISGKIRNRLGHLLAFASGVCLTGQMVLYLLGNLGHQYGWFCNLPLISEGRSSITVNMILLGMILSAYRYDTVIREEINLNRVRTD